MVEVDILKAARAKLAILTICQKSNAVLNLFPMSYICGATEANSACLGQSLGFGRLPVHKGLEWGEPC
jgi:hypothetical protein